MTVFNLLHMSKAVPILQPKPCPKCGQMPTDHTMHTPQTLTIRQAAKLLSISYHTAIRWIAAGRLPIVAFSPKVRRVPMYRLAKLIEASTTGGN